MSGFSLYVHIPYCVAKCPYCDFNSYAASQWPERQYVAALRRELRQYAELGLWTGGEITTIFFGGGTPSLFAAASIGALLDEAARWWTIAPNAEVTLEANPGTVTLDKLHGLRAAGVNRMSFGVQSFIARHLQTLGRIHSAEDAAAAVRWAREAGFARVSIDLIYALPEQTLPEWESDLARACALQPDHISAYNLTYEEGTAFHQWRVQGKLRPLPEEIEVALFTRTQEALGAAGYRQYEISNYARPGEACRHNLNYWQCGSYLGIGAGAHSYARAVNERTGHRGQMTDEDNGTGASTERRTGFQPVPNWGCRWSNEKHPARYITAIESQGHARVTTEVLDERQARGEFVFLGLRCLDGVAATTIRERFGADLPELFPQVNHLRDGDLLECCDQRWRLTPRGLLLADSVFATFL
jgi:oxygen-independent coproporphyrinogen-3 oxidase